MIADISVIFPIPSCLAELAGVQLIGTLSKTSIGTNLGQFPVITRSLANHAWLRELAPYLTDLVTLNSASFLP